MSTTQSTQGLSITTTDHPNATRMREAFAAFARGDLDAVRDSMAPDVVWTTAGSSRLAGTYRGWDEVLGMFGRYVEITGGTATIDLVSVVADDRHAVAIYDQTSTVDGRTETHRQVMVDEVTGEAKPSAVRLMAYDQAAADRHFGA